MDLNSNLTMDLDTGEREEPSARLHSDLYGDDAAAGLTLLALTHTKVEHRLYEVMLRETKRATTKVGSFSVKQLMIQSGIHSYSNVRRARAGLIEKMSIEPQRGTAGLGKPAVDYVVYEPQEIFSRRRSAGLPAIPKELSENDQMPASIETLRKVTDIHNLSRREAQVALKCAEGLSNAEIGEKLFIHEETVKFHLRNIFVKFGVKKRTELMVRLLSGQNQQSAREPMQTG